MLTRTLLILVQKAKRILTTPGLNMRRRNIEMLKLVTLP